MTKYLSVAETAKCVRVALKAAFPAVKFSVRSSSYAGGASIRISWTDGPSTKAVDGVVSVFEGAGFDGMIDMKYNIDAWVLNGEILGTSSTGTEGSRGTVAAWGQIAPHDDAELVSFGADFIFTERKISPAFARKLSAQVAAYWGVTMPEIVEYVGCDHSLYWKLEGDNTPLVGHYFGADLIHQAAADRTRFTRETSDRS